MNYVYGSFALMLMLLAGCTTTGNAKGLPHEESFEYSVIFCEPEKCLADLSARLSGPGEILCALYNVDKSLVSIIDGRAESGAVIIAGAHAKVRSPSVIRTKSKGLMHNKFCVFDGKTVWTGSFNPIKSNKKVYDNVIIINSTLLAGNYLREFEELKANKSAPTRNTRFILNQTLVENYFCPEDGCVRILQNMIRSAEKSVLFATYSFTHPKIANEIIAKNADGVAVRGIIEKGTRYSQYQTLKSAGLNVIEHEDRSIVHHKFFVIDNKTVLTGSFNPTRNGDERNDENVLIIHDEELAGIYVDYFQKLFDKNL